MTIDNEKLTFPSASALSSNEQFPSLNFDPLPEYIEGDTKCDGEDAELSVKAWGSFTDTDGGKQYIANMDEVHVDDDGMVFGIYFTPRDADQPMPPWPRTSRSSVLPTPTRSGRKTCCRGPRPPLQAPRPASRRRTPRPIPPP